MSTKSTKELVDEASLIAHRINVARFSGCEITADDTVRLVELLDMLTTEEVQ